MNNAAAVLLKQARKRLGLSQEALGEQLGVTRAAVGLWEKGGRVSNENIPKLSRITGIDAVAFLPGDDAVAGESGRLHDKLFMPRLQIEEDGRRVPVFRTISHTGKPRDASDFLMSGEIVDQITMPPRFSTRADLRYIYIHSNRMEPRYYESELICFGSIKPAAPNDFALIVLKSESDLKPVMVRRFLKRDAGRIHYEQFNPKKCGSISTEDVENVFPILSTAELAGV